MPDRNRVAGEFPVVGSNGITGWHNEFLIKGPAIIVGRKGSAGEVVWVDKNCFPIDTTYFVMPVQGIEIDKRYLYYVLKDMNLTELRGGGAVPGLNRNDVYESKKIPLPPLEVQQEIVAVLESLQKIIDGAKQVVTNYKPAIKIDPSWEIAQLGDVCKPEYGFTDTAKNEGDARFIRITDIDEAGRLKNDDPKFIRLSDESRPYLLHKADLLVARTGATYGKTLYYDEDYQAVFASYLIRLKFDIKKILPHKHFIVGEKLNPSQLSCLP